jgi:hypothetical protein
MPCCDETWKGMILEYSAGKGMPWKNEVSCQQWPLSISIDRIPKSNTTEELSVIRQLAESQTLETYRTQRIAKDGAVVRDG